MGKSKQEQLLAKNYWLVEYCGWWVVNYFFYTGYQLCVKQGVACGESALTGRHGLYFPLLGDTLIIPIFLADDTG